MKSPEFIAHGTASEADAGKIVEEGFKAQEGRATVSADLIYAFDWATKKERRIGSKSGAEIGEGELGRMIIMKVPEDRQVDYATHTDIEVNEAEKAVTGYSHKYQSGRKQLAIYNEGDIAGKKAGIEKAKAEVKDLIKAGASTEEIRVKRKEAEVPIDLPQENILMSVVPTEELGEKLNDLREQIKSLKKINLEVFVAEISELIKSNQENFLAAGLDVKEVIGDLLIRTIETEIVNLVRGLAIDVKRAKGYTIYNREPVFRAGGEKLSEKEVDINELRQKLEKAKEMVEAEGFDIGLENVNRYLKMSVNKLLAELG